MKMTKQQHNPFWVFSRDAFFFTSPISHTHTPFPPVANINIASTPPLAFIYI